MCNYNLPVIQHICNYILITIFSSLYALMYFHFSELSCTSAINFHGQTIGYTKARYNVYSNCCCAFCLSSFWIKAFFSSSGSALNMKTDLSPMSSWMVEGEEWNCQIRIRKQEISYKWRVHRNHWERFYLDGLLELSSCENHEKKHPHS